ncbi:hypothetical protein NGG16_02700 [Enterococcus casseliflavus]|uniref:hypothetical protein n=1 Tax=Enterococcus casseliflavus TaxID=37734 RepID=UPI002DBAF786|nr:hypothetical protein [Enterococcus casseliflavus]MEB8416343.1 hypothetical protein [Enterococcus casseliflavus]
MMETPRDFCKSVKRIYSLLSYDQQELMKCSLKAMIAYVKRTGDTTGKGAERRFRTFMLLYRHWLISEKKVPVDYFGKRFLEATTDELWEEGKALYRELNTEKVMKNGANKNHAV